VIFVEENGEGPGVRLRKRRLGKSTQSHPSVREDPAVSWEVTPPRKPPSKRPSAHTVILVGIALGLALLLALILAQRYL
jgi:hypothetical protein